MGVVAELVSELKTLRKGRGLFVGQVGDRVGPALSLICGVVETDGPAEIRKKVGGRLEALAAELPDDLRLAVLAAFALHRDAMQPFYQDRVRWVAAKLNRDERTARRRIDEGIERLAEAAASPGIGGGPLVETGMVRWHTEELRVALMADGPVPEAFEFRRIISEEDDLDELDLALTLTVPPGRLDSFALRKLRVHVVYGGTLVPRARESADRFGFALELPRRLCRFGKHEFALRYFAEDDQPVLPHYACVLRQRCDLFDLRVRFDRDNPPRQIRRLAGAFQRDLDDPMPHGDLIDLDRAGELHLTFPHPTPGLVYGVRWEG